jgi:hypothetical protein
MGKDPIINKTNNSTLACRLPRILKPPIILSWIIVRHERRAQFATLNQNTGWIVALFEQYVKWR